MANNQCSGYDGNGPDCDTDNTAEELWFVAAGTGVRTMSLDELDEAFALDVLDASTLVWREGMQAWAPLAVVAGLSAESKEGLANQALALVDDEDKTTQTDVFHRVLLAPTGDRRPRPRWLAAEEASSGQSSVPVAMDVGVWPRPRQMVVGKRWLVGAAALASLCALGINLVTQSLDLARVVGAASRTGARVSMGSVGAVAQPQRSGAQSVLEQETNPGPNSALGEPKQSAAQPPAGLAAYVGMADASRQDPLGSAHPATAVRVKTPMTAQASKRATRGRGSARISALATVGSKAAPSGSGSFLEPLDGEPPR